MKTPREEHEFEIKQNGVMVAIVSGPDRQQALREAMHYAHVYAQDGVTITIAGVGPEDFETLVARKGQDE